MIKVKTTVVDRVVRTVQCIEDIYITIDEGVVGEWEMGDRLLLVAGQKVLLTLTPNTRSKKSKGKYAIMSGHLGKTIAHVTAEEIRKFTGFNVEMLLRAVLESRNKVTSNG